MGWLFRNPDCPRPKTFCSVAVINPATHPKNKAWPAQSPFGEAPQTQLLVIATYIIRIMHFTSVKVIWRLLDELKLFSSLNTVARSTFIKVFTSFEITYYPFTSSYAGAFLGAGPLCHSIPLLFLPFSKKEQD